MPLIPDTRAYALLKQISAVRFGGCVIHTSYGELAIDATEAKPIARALEKLLLQRLRVLHSEAIAGDANHNPCGGVA